MSTTIRPVEKPGLDVYTARHVLSAIDTIRRAFPDEIAVFDRAYGDVVLVPLLDDLEAQARAVVDAYNAEERRRHEEKMAQPVPLLIDIPRERQTAANAGGPETEPDPRFLDPNGTAGYFPDGLDRRRYYNFVIEEKTRDYRFVRVKTGRTLTLKARSVASTYRLTELRLTSINGQKREVPVAEIVSIVECDRDGRPLPAGSEQAERSLPETESEKRAAWGDR